MERKIEVTPSWPASRANGIIATTVFASCVVSPMQLTSVNKLVAHSIMENSASSRSGNIQQWQITRADRIRTLRGKYAFVKISSEDFAARKQREIALASRDCPVQEYIPSIQNIPTLC